MQHAAALELAAFEDPEFHDKLERARRQTTGREKILSTFNDISEQALYLKDLFDFFAVEPAIRSRPGALPAPRPIRAGIEFRNVSFAYPGAGRAVIRNVSFRLEPRGKLALIGENGAGKTTLVKLPARLYDPTATLDARAEHEAFQRLIELTRGRMAVLISHRLSTVRMAGQILVLHHGEIQERGTHDELVALGGRYAELFELQAAGYRSARGGHPVAAHRCSAVSGEPRAARFGRRSISSRVPFVPRYPASLTRERGDCGQQRHGGSRPQAAHVPTDAHFASGDSTKGQVTGFRIFRRWC